MNNCSPIGILDSGVGGLTVWVEIKRLLPEESTIYYADTANCPYGTRSYEEIMTLATKCVEILISQGVKMIVIACNTITAVSIAKFRKQYPEMLFVGMEPAIKPASKITRSGVIGILATQATLQGELYHQTANTLPKGVKIIETAGTGLVEMVENGNESSPECEALVRHYIEPMIAAGADCLVLGCTHYPILTQTINRISDGSLTIINPAPAVALRVLSLLETNSLIRNNSLNSGGSGDKCLSEHRFMSSAPDPEADKVAKMAASMLAGTA